MTASATAVGIRCKMMVQTCSSNYLLFQFGKCVCKHDDSARLQIISFTYVLPNNHYDILLLMSHLSLFCMPVVSGLPFLLPATVISRAY